MNETRTLWQESSWSLEGNNGQQQSASWINSLPVSMKRDLGWDWRVDQLSCLVCLTKLYLWSFLKKTRFDLIIRSFKANSMDWSQEADVRYTPQYQFTFKTFAPSKTEREWRSSLISRSKIGKNQPIVMERSYCYGNGKNIWTNSLSMGIDSKKLNRHHKLFINYDHVSKPLCRSFVIIFETLDAKNHFLQKCELGDRRHESILPFKFDDVSDTFNNFKLGNILNLKYSFRTIRYPFSVTDKRKSIAHSHTHTQTLFISYLNISQYRWKHPL